MYAFYYILMHKDLQTITEIRQRELIILFNTVTCSTFYYSFAKYITHDTWHNAVP